MSEISPFPPLILTLQLDPASFNVFNMLRQQHFPPTRNVLPAHLTLFHALPGDQELAIQPLLQELCSHAPALSLTFPGVRFLGRGVAVEVDCPDLTRLRQQLAKNWNSWLSAQDQQGYRPHITIQNKVTVDEARVLYNQLAHEWTAFDGCGEGLQLWYYRGGPWELAGKFSFK